MVNHAVDAGALKTEPKEFQCPPGLTPEATKAMVVDAVQKKLGPLVTLKLDEPMSVAMMTAENIYIASGRATATLGAKGTIRIKYRAVITRYEPSELWYMGNVTIDS